MNTKCIIQKAWVSLSLVLGLASASSWGQTTVTVGGGGAVTCPAVPTATWTTPPAGVSFSNWSRGSGVTCASAPDGISGSGFNTANAAASMAANAYYKVTITADATHDFVLSSIKWLANVSSSSAKFTVQYKNNGGTLTTFGTSEQSGTGSAISLTFSGSVTIFAGTSIEVFLIPDSATASSTTVRFKNNSTFTVAASAAAYAPTVTSSAATAMTSTSATLNGNVTSDGGSTITSRGFSFKTNSPVALGDNQTTVSGTTGAFTSSPTLSPNTHYYFVAWAINGVGTTLSTPELSFWTRPSGAITLTVGNPTSSSLDVSIASGGGDPSYTLYSIKTADPIPALERFVQLDGTLQPSEVFATSATWGTKTVTGLSPSTAYTFAGRVRGGDGNLTAWVAANAVSTLAAYATQYRSKASGNWNTTATWEQSTDNGQSWAAAVATPTSSAGTITIRHAVTNTTSITVDEVVVASGGVLVMSTAFTVNNGTGSDILVQQGGEFLLVTASTPPTFSSGATLEVANGGVFKLLASGLTDASSVIHSTSVVFDGGAILDYGLTTAPAASGITYFPNADATTIPAFRLSAAISGAVGDAANTVVNGVTEVSSGASITWTGAGTKTLRNGLRGAGSMTQGTAGPIIVSGAIAELGGSGTLTLGSSGLQISSGSVVTMSSDKTVSGTMTVDGTLHLNSHTLTGGVTVGATGRLKGNGTATGAVVVNGLVAPGASIGTLGTGNATWAGGGSYEFEINDALGTAGSNPGWDLLNIAGNLTISATSLSKFTITNVSLGGAIANFIPTNHYGWKLATVSGTITGFDENAFAVDSSGFANSTAGTFHVGTNGDAIYLYYQGTSRNPKFG